MDSFYYGYGVRWLLDGNKRADDAKQAHFICIYCLLTMHYESFHGLDCRHRSHGARGFKHEKVCSDGMNCYSLIDSELRNNNGSVMNAFRATWDDLESQTWDVKGADNRCSKSVQKNLQIAVDTSLGI